MAATTAPTAFYSPAFGEGVMDRLSTLSKEDLLELSAELDDEIESWDIALQAAAGQESAIDKTRLSYLVARRRYAKSMAREVRQLVGAPAAPTTPPPEKKEPEDLAFAHLAPRLRRILAAFQRLQRAGVREVSRQALATELGTSPLALAHHLGPLVNQEILRVSVSSAQGRPYVYTLAPPVAPPKKAEL